MKKIVIWILITIFLLVILIFSYLKIFKKNTKDLITSDKSEEIIYNSNTFRARRRCYQKDRNI